MGARLTRLFAGLVLFGASMAMLVRAGLGVDPWDVFHQGVATRLPLSFGGVVIATSFVVLALWWPLPQRPGLGTLANAVVVGLAADATLAALTAPGGLAARWALLVVAIVLNGVATGLYIGAGLGPGPRDGLMTGLAALGHPIFLVRTLIEVTVLGLGWSLGGTVGIGTILFAVAIGPLSQVFIPLFTLRGAAGPGAASPRAVADPTRP